MLTAERMQRTRFVRVSNVLFFALVWPRVGDRTADALPRVILLGQP